MFKKITRLMKRAYLTSILRVQCSGENIIKCGNDYGGFLVATDILDKINKKRNLIVYSFGIGEDLSFSKDVLKRWNCDIYAFDPTPKAVQYVKQSNLVKSEGFHFYEWGISDQNGTGKFHLPKEEIYVPKNLVGYSDVQEVSGSIIQHEGVEGEIIDVELKTLKTIMRCLNHETIDLLKMDIEGAEFAVIDEILNSGIVFKELCVEIHNRLIKKDDKKIKRVTILYCWC